MRCKNKYLSILLIVPVFLLLLANPQTTTAGWLNTEKFSVTGGVVTQLYGGEGYFSPDGRNIGGGGNTISAYVGTKTIEKMVQAGGGVVTLFNDGEVYFSPDGRNIGGGGNSVRAYYGSQKVVEMVPVSSDGLVTLFDNGAVFFSPDGRNIGGGGNTISAYTKAQKVVKMVAAGGGVVTLFSGGGAYFSPDGKNIGGGGNTIRAYGGSQRISGMVGVSGGGVLTRFSGDEVYFSPDGRCLDAILAYKGTLQILQAVSIFGGLVTLFDNGAVFLSSDGRDIGGGGNTMPAYTKSQKVVKIAAAGGGVVTLFSGGGAYFSPDGKNIGGGGNTIRAYDGSQRISGMVAVTSSEGWISITKNAAFGSRDSAKGVIFNNKMWLSSGFFSSDCGSTSYYDLWYSTDMGKSWTMAAGDPNPGCYPSATGVPYSAYSALAVFKNKMWAIGTRFYYPLSNYVFESTNGAEWNNTFALFPSYNNQTQEISANEVSRAFVLNNKLYFVDPSGDQYGVTAFVSSDGRNWSQFNYMSSPVKLNIRHGATVAASRGKIWLMGGGDYTSPLNDIWSIADEHGEWERQSEQAAWSPRMWSCLKVDGGDRMWLAGGYIPSTGKNLNEVWYSDDGTTWKQLITPTAFEPRHATTCYINGNILSIVAGKGGSDPNNDLSAVINDVWNIVLPSR